MRLEGCGCTPWIPAGTTLRHSSLCPKYPNKALTAVERDAYQQTLREERRAAMADHPAGGRVVPVVIVHDNGYADYWSDRDDDTGEE